MCICECLIQFSCLLQVHLEQEPYMLEPDEIAGSAAEVNTGRPALTLSLQNKFLSSKFSSAKSDEIAQRVKIKSCDAGILKYR